MIKKLHLRIMLTLGLIAALFVSALSPFVPSTLATDYHIHTTNKVELGGDSPAGPCTNGVTEGWTSFWSEFMSPNPMLANSYRNTWNYTSNYDNARIYQDAFSARFFENLAAGSGWAISQHAPGYAGTGRAITIYLFSPDAQISVHDSYLHVDTGDNLQMHSFVYNPNMNCRWQDIDYGSPTNGNRIDAFEDSPLLFVASDHINYPDDYTGEHVNSIPPPPLNYVALGDSFSSGEGNPPFEAGTEESCHRSSSAYPRLLASSLYLNLTNFVACGGATTNNVIDEGSWGEAPQITALSYDTDIVTLTVGGNDVGFKEFATACSEDLCDFSTKAYQDIYNNITNKLSDKLNAAYTAIDHATSNNAKVYVLGYPYIAPAEMPTGASSMCFPLNGGNNNPDPKQNNGAAVYAVQSQLNATIQQAVSNYNSTKFQYVDPNKSDSPFIGHDWCSQDRYFNIITVNSVNYSYHPNTAGHAAYANVLSRAWHY